MLIYLKMSQPHDHMNHCDVTRMFLYMTL